MPVALGFIETDSVIAAVEAANEILKNSNILIAGKETAGSGIITIKFIGETESVRSALKTGEEAAKKIGKNVTVHLISEPHENLLAVLPEISSYYFHLRKNLSKDILQKEENGKAAEEVIISNENLEKQIEIKPKKRSGVKIKPAVEIKRKKAKILEKPVEEKKESHKNYVNDTIARLRQEALGLFKPADKEKERKTAKKPEKKLETENTELDSLNVHRLRKLARGTSNFPIKGREISKANREVLLKYLKDLK
jgi:microcompartment protein CcmL/EutN